MVRSRTRGGQVQDERWPGPGREVVRSRIGWMDGDTVANKRRHISLSPAAEDVIPAESATFVP